MTRPPVHRAPLSGPVHARTALQHDLGLDSESPDLDRFAQRIAEAGDAPYAMVNIFGPGRQQFLGLCNPAPGSGLPQADRHMPLDWGWCPEVVETRQALVLPNVHARPQFSGNTVVDRMNIHTYAGAPLIHHSGTVLGTVCWVGPEPRPLDATALEALQKIKSCRDDLMSLLYRRAGLQPPQ